MATKSRSQHQGNLYKSYQAQNRQAANRKRKLTKLAKEQPNNEQITKALANIKYRRHTPNEPKWSHTEKDWAQTKKAFSKLNHGMQRNIPEKDMFKLRMRAHDGRGNLLWNF